MYTHIRMDYRLAVHNTAAKYVMEVNEMVNRITLADEFVSLRDAMDRFFSDSFPTGAFRGLSATNGSGRFNLPLDVYGSDNEIVVIAAVPGIEPDQIELTINQNTVTIRGELRNVASSEEAKNATWYLHELPYGNFQRSLTLPVDVDVAKADATFDHGILKLRLPKAESAQPKQIKVRTVSNDQTQKIEAGTSQNS
jgi:HSP20 family protein